MEKPRRTGEPKGSHVLHEAGIFLSIDLLISNMGPAGSLRKSSKRALCG